MSIKMQFLKSPFKSNLKRWSVITEKNSKNVTHCHRIETVRYFTHKNYHTEVNKIVNFDGMINERRTQAQKSVLVQVNSEKSFSDLHKYCSQYGTIVGAHHYSVKDDHYILAEYSEQQEANEVIDHCIYNDEKGGFVKSPFLWFRSAQNSVTGCNGSKLKIVNGCQPIDYSKIMNQMIEAESIANQMLILYKSTMLNDLGIRLRFLAARQVEQSLSSICPEAKAHIFGSSVNGFGKLGCDLDLIFELHATEREVDPTSRLVFQTKESLANARSQTQRQLEILSDIMENFIPGIHNVRRILQARVPIVRYHHLHLDLDVDLSMNNRSGVYMSELLYNFGQIDDRVSPLVFCIRRWAQTESLTNPSPGNWISNFSLTCLVIFYLQQLKQPVLPSINSFYEQTTSNDNRFFDGDIRCNFLRDLNLLKFSKQNKASLDDLLFGFFEFYSQFNFDDRAISLNDTKVCSKFDYSPMYIINPLEPNLNISRNISSEECSRFGVKVRNASWILQSVRERDVSGTWGLLSLFRSHDQPTIKPKMFFKPRMVNVKNLFDGTENKGQTDGIVDQNVSFKNMSVKKEVTKIKKQVRLDVKSMNWSGKNRNCD